MWPTTPRIETNNAVPFECKSVIGLSDVKYPRQGYLTYDRFQDNSYHRTPFVTASGCEPARLLEVGINIALSFRLSPWWIFIYGGCPCIYGMPGGVTVGDSSDSVVMCLFNV